MTGETANRILKYLRRLERMFDAMRHDLRGMRAEMQSVIRQLSNLGQGQSLINRRLDRLDERVTRIERRLDPVEG